MFITVAKASSTITTKMYLEAFLINHHAMSIGCSQREQIVEENMFLMGYDRVSSIVDTYEEDIEIRMNSTMVIESVMLMAENFVDISNQNDDVDKLVDEDEPSENDPSLLGGNYEVPSLLYKELNWDVINAMSG